MEFKKCSELFYQVLRYVNGSKQQIGFISKSGKYTIDFDSDVKLDADELVEIANFLRKLDEKPTS